MSMTDRLTEGLLKVASKISNQRHMTAIKNAFTALLPIIIMEHFVRCLVMLCVVQLLQESA